MDALNPDTVATLSFRDQDRPERPPQAVFVGRLRTALVVASHLDPSQRARAVITAEGLPAEGIPPPSIEEVAEQAGVDL